MGDIFGHKRLLGLTIITAGIQQICVAYSTYELGRVGSDLFQLHAFSYWKMRRVFFAIGAAYLAGAISYRVSVQLGLAGWEHYCRSVLGRIQGASDLDTPKNKATAFAWLGGEALVFFESAADTLQDSVSSFANFVLHLLVLNVLLGISFSAAMATSLILSGVLLAWGRRQLENLNQAAQTQRAQVLMTQMGQWDSHLLGNCDTQTQAYQKHRLQLQHYQQQLNRKVFWNQVYEIAPIECALIIFALCFRSNRFWDPAHLGSVVATLPRMIQLLQQNSTINQSITKLIGLRAKLKQLHGFVGQLERLPLSRQIHADKLVICRMHGGAWHTITLPALWSHLDRVPLAPGRYRIRGGNGAGKTSLLKWIKKRYPQAAYVGATGFLEAGKGSTGEKQADGLLSLGECQGGLFLLDEWDAHLDAPTRARLDAFLLELSASNCLVEVSHHLA